MITILCSNYNSIEWIEGYLDSLNNQTYSYFNVVVVDANSDDGSLDIINNFVFRDGIDVKVIECKDRISVYDAWNIAIENCDTKYVMNFNTDDRLYPSAIETYMVYAVQFPEVDIFYGPCDVFSDIDHSIKAWTFDWSEYSHEELLQRCICGPFPLVKRQSIIDAGMFDGSFDIIGDYEMWLRMSYRGYKFRRIPNIVGSYYFNPTGLSSDMNNRAKIDKQNKIVQERYRR